MAKRERRLETYFDCRSFTSSEAGFQYRWTEVMTKVWVFFF